jgi:hypothetical protein
VVLVAAMMDTAKRLQRPQYFVSSYTDGPSTRWNVIDRLTQEWVRRFPSKEEAEQYAEKLESGALMLPHDYLSRKWGIGR